MIEIILIVTIGVAVLAMVGYQIAMNSKKIDGAVLQLDRAFRENVIALQDDRADLEAQSCGKDCAKRKPTSIINEEKLNRIGEKFYINHLEDSKEQIESCSECGDTCDKCQCAEDEQDATEAREEVEELGISSYPIDLPFSMDKTAGYQYHFSNGMYLESSGLVTEDSDVYWLVINDERGMFRVPTIYTVLRMASNDEGWYLLCRKNLSGAVKCCVYPTKNNTQDVAEANKEAAESSKFTQPLPMLENKNHAIANKKVFTATKNALKASIKDGDAKTTPRA